MGARQESEVDEEGEKEMKNLIIDVSTVVFVLLLIYLGGAYLTLEPNILEWDHETRTDYVVFNILGFTVSTFVSIVRRDL